MQVLSGLQANRIYLIRVEDTDYYKVGHPQNPHSRISDLQTGNPRKLIYLCSVQENESTDEKKVHQHLADYRVELGGGTEWFKIPEGEMEVVYETIRDINSAEFERYFQEQSNPPIRGSESAVNTVTGLDSEKTFRTFRI